MIITGTSVTDLGFSSAHYTHITALFDAVLCSENNLKDIQSFLKEMYRVLKTGGVYLLISHGAPDNRVNHIKRYIDVDIDVVPIRKFLNVCSALYFSVFLTRVSSKPREQCVTIMCATNSTSLHFHHSQA